MAFTPPLSPTMTVLRLATVVLCVSLGLVPARAAEPQAQAFPPGRVRLLDGPFKRIQELHRTGLVGQLEPDRLLFPFRKNAGLPQPAGVSGGYGGWDDQFITGHYGGHYLSAAARLYAATGDATFRDKVNAMVKGLAECQDRLGGSYLAAFPASQFDRLETTPRASSVEYYTVHKILAGLVDAAELCDNAQALAMAGKLADYFAARIAKLTPERIEALFRTDYTGNPTNEYGGMAAALTDLYQVARRHGDPAAARHLALAKVFNREWLIAPLVAGENRLDGLHGNTHIAQMGGVARHALATGDEREGKAAAEFWRQVVERHSFANGSNTFHEKLRAPGIEVAGTGVAALSPLTAESCNTHNMLKLTGMLFEREPAAAYADYYENALYNHILATIAPDHGLVMYHLSMRPGDFRVHIHEPFCCLGTGIETAARFGDAIYFHHGNQLWVNLYIPSALAWTEQGIQLKLDTRYPEEGRIQLALTTAKPVAAALHLRVPGWLDGSPQVAVNGAAQPVAAKPGSFLTLNRVWRDGDIITLHLPLALRVRPSRDDPAMVSFFYGPVILAGELGREGMPASDVGGHLDHSTAPAWPVPVLVSATPQQAVGLLTPVAGEPLRFQARLTYPADRREAIVRLAPFHQVHHQRFALYWKSLPPDQLPAR
jgi:DUF1680 family protein